MARAHSERKAAKAAAAPGGQYRSPEGPQRRSPGMRRWLAVGAGLSALALAAYLDLPSRMVGMEGNRPATVSEVKELLEVTAKPEALASVAAESMREQLRTAPNVDPRAFQIVTQEVNTYITQGLNGGLGDRLAPVFEKRFTADEVRQILSFYRSPAGRKMSEQMPVIASESTGIAQQWMLDNWPQLSQRVEGALSRAGVTLPTRPAPQTLPLTPPLSPPLTPPMGRP